MIRLILALLSLGISSLTLFKAQKIPLWMLSIGATEYGCWFLLLPLILLATGPGASWIPRSAWLINLMALVLYLVPLVQAGWLSQSLASNLPGWMRETGRGLDRSSPPLVWTDLWLGKSPEPVAVRTLRFSDAGGGLDLDFYPAVRPEGDAAPCLIVLHTGGWNSGSRAEFPGSNHELARLGFAVAAVDYRLAPGAVWPAQREDVLTAIRFLKENAGLLGLDPESLVIMGRSAGGQIAEAVALSKEVTGIRGCIALYAPADMNFAWDHRKPNDILDTNSLLSQYLGGIPPDAQDNFDSASPIQHLAADSPPFLLMHGVRDSLVWVEQSRRFAAEMEKSGTRHYYCELPWATHAFDYPAHGPGHQISTWLIVRFLHAITGK